jgi:ABC-type amino acid transport substrate-binding protein
MTELARPRSSRSGEPSPFWPGGIVVETPSSLRIRRRFAYGLVASLLLFGLLPSGAHADREPGSLIVGTKNAPPFAIHNEDGSWSGISIDLWRVLASDLGVRFELRELELDELIAGLESGELDAVVAAMTVTSEREARVDFSHPFFYSGLTVVVPADVGGSIFGWLSGVFNRGFFEAVLVLMAVLLAAGVAVWLFERQRNPAQFGGSATQGLASAFWWSAVTMTTVGYGDKAPKTLGGRAVAIVWMFAAVIVTSGLTAAIASSLTVNRLQSRIDELRDLKDSSIAVVADSTSAAYLKSRGYRIKSFDTLDQGLDALGSGEAVALVHDEPIVLHEILSDPERYADLNVLPTSFAEQDYAIGMPQRSPLREPLNQALLRRTQEDRWEQTLQYYLGH